MDIKKVYLTWANVCDLAETIAFKIKLDNWRPSLIVGLTRGGLLPAKMLSHSLDVEMSSLDVSLRDGSLIGPTSTWLPELLKDDHKILIVDDISDSGATQQWIKNDWKSTIKHIPKHAAGNWPSDYIKFTTLIHNLGSSETPDYHGKTIDKRIEDEWYVFPWESWHIKDK